MEILNWFLEIFRWCVIKFGLFFFILFLIYLVVHSWMPRNWSFRDSLFGKPIPLRPIGGLKYSKSKNLKKPLDINKKDERV